MRLFIQLDFNETHVPDEATRPLRVAVTGKVADIDVMLSDQLPLFGIEHMAF